MKFRSMEGDVHLALTTGHTAVVTPEGVKLDRRFHKEAISRGCLPEGVQPDEPVAATGFDRMAVIKNAINGMLDGGADADFKADGTPNLTRLSKVAGFTVSREEADKAWAEVSKVD